MPPLICNKICDKCGNQRNNRSSRPNYQAIARETLFGKRQRKADNPWCKTRC